jgi:hypothetical protein
MKKSLKEITRLRRVAVVGSALVGAAALAAAVMAASAAGSPLQSLLRISADCGPRRLGAGGLRIDGGLARSTMRHSLPAGLLGETARSLRRSA